VRCGANERVLLVALYDYAQQHHGSLPASLTALQQNAANPGAISKLLICPEGHTTLIYRGGGLNLKMIPKDTILVYELPANHTDSRTGKAAMNVGYADGSVRLITQPQANNIIAELKAGHNPPRAEMIK